MSGEDWDKNIDQVTDEILEIQREMGELVLEE